MATPHVEQDEGACDILMVRRERAPKLSRWRAVGVFLAGETGEHIEMDEVDVVKVKKMRLRPGRSAYRGSRGHIQLSGQEQEVPSEGKYVEVEVLSNMVKVMM